MPGGWCAESGIDSSSNRFRRRRGRASSLTLAVDEQANNAEETRFGAFLKASQTLAERERQRFHGLGLTIL